MALPPKRSKANLNSTCIWGYQLKTGAASRGGKLIPTPTALSLFDPCFLPLSFLIYFFLSSSLVQFSPHHHHSTDAWIQMSSGRRSLRMKRTSTFSSLLGCNSQIDGFALLIFGTWIAPLAANAGVLKHADEGVTSAALTWSSLSSGGWFLTWTVTHVALSHGLRRWNGIHYSDKGRTWLLTCSCTLCVVKIKQDWMMCVHWRCQWGWNVFNVT